MRLLFLLQLFIGAMVFEIAQMAYSPSKETEIRSETVLDASYDPVSRPHAETLIKVGLNVLAIEELDIKGQKLTMAGWFTFEWEDDRIVWDKAAKDDIEYIFSQPKYIWKPELVVDNALEDLDVIHLNDLLLRVKYTGEVEWDPQFYCQLTVRLQDLDILSNDALLLRLKYDGTVDWEPPLLFVTHCEVDITYYPYDQQRCAVEIVSWTYTIEEVKLGHLFEKVNLEDFERHGEWEITHTEVEDKNLTEHLPDGIVRIYPQLDFWMYLRRRTQFYNLNVMMPIILTSLMVVLVFIVPVDSGEKVSYVLTVFLALAVLLTIVADSLPPTSITLSVLGLYLGIVLILAAFGILLTVFILILFHKEGKPKENTFIVKMATCAAKMIGWKSTPLTSPSKDKVVPIKGVEKIEICDIPSDYNKDVKNGTTGNEEPLNKFDHEGTMVDDNFDVTWKVIAQILDRFSFYFFLFITISMNFSFVVALVTGGSSNGH